MRSPATRFASLGLAAALCGVLAIVAEAQPTKGGEAAPPPAQMQPRGDPADSLIGIWTWLPNCQGAPMTLDRSTYSFYDVEHNSLTTDIVRYERVDGGGVAIVVQLHLGVSNGDAGGDSGERPGSGTVMVRDGNTLRQVAWVVDGRVRQFQPGFNGHVLHLCFPPSTR
jgi:hypothetical protein